MKKLFNFILIAILIIGITGCSKENEQEKMISHLELIGYKCDESIKCTLEKNAGYSYSMIIPNTNIDLENAKFERVYNNGDKIEIYVAAYSIEDLSAIYTTSSGEKYKLYDENTPIFKEGKYVLCDHYEGEKRNQCDLIWQDVNETKKELEKLFKEAEIELVKED